MVWFLVFGFFLCIARFLLHLLEVASFFFTVNGWAYMVSWGGMGRLGNCILSMGV